MRWIWTKKKPVALSKDPLIKSCLDYTHAKLQMVLEDGVEGMG